MAGCIAALVLSLVGIGAARTPAVAASICVGVSLPAGADIQAEIDARPEGTTFCLASGTYRVPATIYPKSYDVLWGGHGTVITGGDTVQYGFGGLRNPAEHVTLRGLIIRDFASDGIRAGAYWKIIGNQIAYNHDVGLRLRSYDVIGGNKIHHNGRLGFNGFGVSGVVIRNNEVAFNNTLGYARCCGAGAKVFSGTDMQFLDNYVHDNTGHGLQCDTDCRNVLFDGNRVVNNANCGIFYEKSYDAIIRNNTVVGNGAAVAWWGIAFGSQIHLNTSEGVQIYSNVAIASVPGTNGIGMSDVDRGTGPYGTYILQNNSTHDNVVKMHEGGRTGIYDITHDPTSPERNNVFDHNTYHVDALRGAYYSWGLSSLTWRQWRATGQDVHSTRATW